MMGSILDSILERPGGGIAEEVLTPGAVPTTFDQWAQQATTMQRRVPQPYIVSDQLAPKYKNEPVEVPVDDPEHGFGTALTAGMMQDPEAALRQISEQSGVPLEKMGYWGGDIVRIGDDGKPYAMTGGAEGTAGGFMASAPEIIGGIGGEIIGATRGKPHLGGGIGAAAGVAVKRGIASLIFDDDVSGIGTLGEMATEFGVDWAASRGMRGLGGAFTRSGLPGLEKLDARQTKELIEQVYRDTGIHLDAAQATGLPQLIGLKRYAANYPGESAAVVEAHELLLQGQATKAIRKLARTLSKTDDPAAQGLAVNIAQAALMTAKAQVDAVSGPMYKEAFLLGKQGVELDTSVMFKQLDVLDEYAAGSGKSLWKDIRANLLENKPRKVEVKQPDGSMKEVEETYPKSDLEALHKVKMYLDDLIEGRVKVKGNSVTADEARDLMVLKETLVGSQERGTKGIMTSPDNPATQMYADGMETFAKGMQEIVNPLENSVIGVIAKIPDYKAAQTASTMFAGNAADTIIPASAIKKARAAFLREEGGEEAWKQVTAAWIYQTLNRSLTETQAGGSAVAGKWLNAAWRNPAQQAALKAAVGPEGREALMSIVNALKMARRAPTGSSATQFNKILDDQVGEGSAQFFSRLLAPRSTVIDYISGSYKDKAAKAVAEALTDPNKLDELLKMKSMSKSTERNLGILGLVFGSAILSSGQELMKATPEDGLSVKE